MTNDFFAGSNGASIVDVPRFFDSGIPDAIAALVSLGVLVSVGTTRDRGAVSITVTSDGQYRREYFRDAPEAVEFLRRATAALRGAVVGRAAQEAPGSPLPSRGPRRASRGSM